MPEYLAPGVYVEEVEMGPRPIEGVSTSTAGFVGMTQRGPTSGRPVLVTSFADYERKFGGFFDVGSTFASDRYLPYAVEGFFACGGRRLYVMRVKSSDASKAQANAQGGLVTRLQENAVVGQTKFKVASLRGLQDGSTLVLRMVKGTVSYESNVLTIAANGINRATNEITVNAITITPTGPAEFDTRFTAVLTDVRAITVSTGAVTTLTAPTASRPDTFQIQAKDEGSWGRDIIVLASHETGARSIMTSLVAGATTDNTNVVLQSTAGFYPDAWVEIDRGREKIYRRVRAVGGNTITLYGNALTGTALDPQGPAATTTVFSVCEFKLTVTYRGVTEQFPNLTLTNVPGRYYFDRINNGSSLISVTAPVTNTHPFLFPSGQDGRQIVLDTNGGDGTVALTPQDYRGTDGGPGNRTGLRALEDVDEVSIIAVPGVTGSVVQTAMIEQCERLMDRFAILDPRPRSGNVAPTLEDIQNQRQEYDSRYAAIYYPRLMMYDPLTNASIPVPPSGHMAGIYARTDNQRGVHKAPANETLLDITGLEVTVTKGEQEILNQRNINVLRDFRTDRRGFRVWGARCITSDVNWKYINVRRLFIYVEESLDEGTQWVVFEPNDERLWARVRQTVSIFLTRVWRDGALMGTKPEEAFFVQCDRSTMSQDDLDNGRLIMLIGIAPVKPAEFVIIRIGQWAGGSQIEES